MVSPTRRVLGAKDSNAPVHVQDPQCKSQATAGQADPVSRLSVRRPLSPSSDSVPGSPRAGQKRRIDEIEEEDHNNDSPRTNATHLLSQRTELLSDSGSDRGTTSPPSLTQTKSTMNTTSTTSFHPSQEESSPIEVQFEIREEISQQTLDNMHAITLPQSHSQLLPPLQPNLVKETSQISVSMSSLIDFDQSDSSQQDDSVHTTEHAEAAVVPAAKTKGELRKEMLVEKAETLRTRLQLALYKVQTNQASKPFARLQVPKARSSSPELPPPSSSTPRRTSSTTRISLSHTIPSPESQIALARAKATMQEKPAIQSLGGLSVPTIVPTSFSSRWNEGLVEEEGPKALQADQIPSSPPLSRGHETLHVRQSLEAKRRPGPEMPRTPIQLSSPPGSDDGGAEDGRWKSRDLTYGGLTSSVVKGEAASGLLELMRGARQDGEGRCGR